jgi:ADP-heptose:LPS heptosyltransferase
VRPINGLFFSGMKRLILSRPDRIGDVIITSAILPKLKACLPESEIFLLAHGRMSSLFQDHPLLAGFLPLADLPQTFRELRAETIVHFQADSVVAAAAQQAAIPVRLGYRESLWTPHLTLAVPDDRPLGLGHEAAAAWKLLTALGLPAWPQQDWHPAIALPESARALLQARLPWPMESTSYFVVNPTAHSSVLRWPWPRFLSVMEWLNKTYAAPIILIGADGADPSLTSLFHAAGERGLPVVNLAGHLDLAELGWLLRGAKLLLARNSGPSHLAAAVNCPQVEIFIRHTGRYSVKRWQALSEKSVVVQPEISPFFCEPNPSYWRCCADSISVERVCEAVTQSLDLA